MKFFLLLIALPAFGAVTDVRVSTSHTQAIISYTVAANETCAVRAWDMNLPIFISSATGNGTTLTINTRGLAHGLDLSTGIGQTVWIEGTGVSEWDNRTHSVASTPTATSFTIANNTAGSASSGLVGTLVHDINGTLFSGADQDNRAGNVNSGRSRQFILGNRLVATASNGKRYSRALQAKADGPAPGRHTFIISCPSDTTYVGAFTTATIPLGNAAEVETTRSDPAAPGTPMIPSFDLRGRAERLGGVAVERVIEPASGMMHTSAQIAGEIINVADYEVGTTNSRVNAPTGWTDPANVLTDDASSAVYSGAGKDILCLTSFEHKFGSPEPNYIAGTGSSYDSIRPLIKASAAGTGADAQIEVALGDAGSCATPVTDWQTLQLTGSLATYRFPASATPKAALADWISTVGAHIPSVVDLQPRLGGSLIADGTSTVTLSLNPLAVYFRAGGNAYFDWAFFNSRWTSGIKIRIGAEITSGMSRATEEATIDATCASGTEYTISSYNSPIGVTLTGTVAAGTNLSWCVGQTTLLIRKKTTSTDSITLQYVNYDTHSSRAAVTDSGGNAKRMSDASVTDAAGNRGYLLWQQDLGLYWISEDNGESRRIMGSNLPARTGKWVARACLANESTANSADPAEMICVLQDIGNITNHIVRVKIHWSGSGIWAHQPAIGLSSFPECSETGTPTPNPCITMNIINEGYTIESLVNVRDSRFDVTKFNCSMTNVALQYVAIKCLRGAQDTVGWAVIWDLTRDIANYVGNQATNPVIAAFYTNDKGGWWGGIHGFTVIGPNVAKLGIHNPWESNPAVIGTGPFVMATTAGFNNTTDLGSCPANDWNYTQCTTVTVTSEPYDPAPVSPETGAGGEYGPVEIGQPVVIWPCDIQDPRTCIDTALGAQNWEWGVVVAKSGSAPTISLTLARNIGVPNTPTAKTWATAPFLNLQQLTDGSPPTAPTTPRLDIPEPLMTWAFLDHPTGGNRLAIGRSAYDSSHIGCTHIACMALGEPGVIAYAPPIPSVVGAIPPPIATAAFPGFNRKNGPIYADRVETYWANHQTADGASTDPNRKFGINAASTMHNVNDNAQSPQLVKVGGTTYIYKASLFEVSDGRQVFFHAFAKGIPLVMTAGWHPLKEVSGPSCALADTSADWYKFCFVYRDGEAWSGSKKGEVYANIPYAQRVSYGDDYVCAKGGFSDLNDICLETRDPFTEQNIQYVWGLHNNLRKGQDFRKLGSSFSYLKFRYSAVPKVFPNGKMLGPLVAQFGVDRYRTQSLFAKIPPTPPADSINRLLWVPVPLSVGSAPSGTVAAQVEFGYHEWPNAVGIGYGCTSRLESCLATASAIPASIASLHSGPLVAWIQADNYVVASQNPLTFNYTNHGLYDGQRVAGHYGENRTIGVTDANTFTWVGTTTEHAVSDQLRMSHWREDSPWLFASDGCSVGAASNATPIAVRCSSGAHNLATGSRVFIAGVGGNTAANGFWTVTVTGEATFTLDTSVGNGAYTSGGTIAPGGQACASGCTVTVPAMSQRVMYYRWKYLNSAGAVIATSGSETMVTP